MRTTMWMAVAAAIFGVVGCGTAAATSETTRTAPTAAASPSATSAPLTPAELAYVDYLRAITDLNNDAASLVETGHQICSFIGDPGLSRVDLMGKIMAAGWSTDAVWMLDSAERHLCPERTYAATYSSPTTAAAPTAAASGPHFGIYTDGVYEVGVDIVAGKWRTSGGQGCYWARLKPESRDIIDNGIVNGPEIVWLKDGELFETTRCGSWAVAPS